MRLDTSDELFLAGLIEDLRSAIQVRSRGDLDRQWALAGRLSRVLAAQGHVYLARCLGLAKAQRFDTPISIVVDGEPHATYKAGFLRTEAWVGMAGSIQSVIDVPALRDDIMSREEIGDEALPSLMHDEEEGA